jgi:hypothetical protein
MALAIARVIMVVPFLARDIAVASCMMFCFAFVADGVGTGHIGGIV